MIERYPLNWPQGWPRTLVGQQRRAQFVHYGKRLTIFQGAERVMEELKRLGVNENDVVISTNVRTRLDGMPRSDQKEPDDHGASVYWRDLAAPGNPMRCMAIDRYTSVADNLAAIAATLEALRAIERHGGAPILDRAFTGFTALPEKASMPWREVLKVQASVKPTSEYIKNRFRELAHQHHPDRGGDADKFRELVAARDQALAELQEAS